MFVYERLFVFYNVMLELNGNPGWGIETRYFICSSPSAWVLVFPLCFIQIFILLVDNCIQYFDIIEGKTGGTFMKRKLHPMSPIYARLIKIGKKKIEDVPHDGLLRPDVQYLLKRNPHIYLVKKEPS